MGDVPRSRPTPDPAGVLGKGRRPGRAERLEEVLGRDGNTCIWCGRAFGGLVRPTTEHVVPRVKGGPSWLENEVAACGRCNSERGHRTPVEWLEECERRGWRPDAARLTRALSSLEEAIGRIGGQRRARPYLDAQLRRLHRRVGHGPAAALS
jgi:HNH endonuclease